MALDSNSRLNNAVEKSEGILFPSAAETKWNELITVLTSIIKNYSTEKSKKG